MSRREHVLELRDRLAKACLAVALGTVVGWFLYSPVVAALVRPLYEIAQAHPHPVLTVDVEQILGPLDPRLEVSIYVGCLLSSPVWLYQLWAFVVRGSSGSEKRVALAFTGTAVPLLFGGIATAWLLLPNTVPFLTGSTLTDTATIIEADEYLSFALWIMLVFAIAFVLSLLLVAVNMARPPGAAGTGTAGAPLA